MEKHGDNNVDDLYQYQMRVNKQMSMEVMQW
jgi:hypothetical protein